MANYTTYINIPTLDFNNQLKKLVVGGTDVLANKNPINFSNVKNLVFQIQAFLTTNDLLTYKKEGDVTKLILLSPTVNKITIAIINSSTLTFATYTEPASTGTFTPSVDNNVKRDSQNLQQVADDGNFTTTPLQYTGDDGDLDDDSLLPKRLALKVPIELTYATAQNLVTNGTIVANQLYKITNAAGVDTGLLLMGSSNPKVFLTRGFAGYLNPDFHNVGAFESEIRILRVEEIDDFTIGNGISCTHASSVIGTGIILNKYIDTIKFIVIQVLTGTFAEGDTVQDTVVLGSPQEILSSTEIAYNGNVGIWVAANEGGYVNSNVVIRNGEHYIIHDDAVFDSNPPETNTLAYTRLPKTLSSVGYVEEWDAVDFDFTNNHIVERFCKRGNRVGSDFAYMGSVLGGNNPVPHFQWGNDEVRGNKIFNHYYDWRNYVPAVADDKLQNYGSTLMYDKNIYLTAENYTIKQTDNGKHLRILGDGSSTTILIPTNLAYPFSCLFTQVSDDFKADFSSDGEAIKSFENNLVIAGTNATASLVMNVDNVPFLSGNLITP